MSERLVAIGSPPQSPLRDAVSSRPDWAQADPAWIARALSHARALPHGGWLVIDASRAITAQPRKYTVLGREWVFWRAEGKTFAAPDACPHMGASLSEGRVQDGKLVCPWHGLALGPKGHGAWKCVPCHDDGVLVWARLVPTNAPTDAPILAPRPRAFLDGVISMEAACEPADVIQNRLDPWHGAHFHPHSFARLRVTEMRDELIRLRVFYRVVGPIGVEVDATFHCPEPNTIVMTIVDGEGEGSVVETHATPVRDGRTRITEATLATSSRAGFQFARHVSRFVRPFVEARARRLWVEDAAYAERLYALRTGAVTP